MSILHKLGVGLVYLATPYTNFLPNRDEAFRQAAFIAARLVAGGIPVFCPVVHGHPLSVYGKLPAEDHSFWMEALKPMMAKCDALVIVKMLGWETSKGIAVERDIFECAGKPVFFVNPDNIGEVERACGSSR